MHEMTEEEVEAAVAHDMKILEEHWKEQRMQFPEVEYVTSPGLDARLVLLEARFDSRIQAARADLMRWTLIVFGIATLVTALIVKL